MSHNRTDKVLLGTGANVVHDKPIVEKDVVLEERLVTDKLAKTTLVDRDERVVREAPIVKKDIVTEHPEIIHKEHHIQPIIHEKEVHVKPIHRVEVTTERPVVHQEKIVEGPIKAEKVVKSHKKVTAATVGAGATIIEDRPIVKTHVVTEHPEIIHKEHHIQPIIHEKERHIEPIHKTEVTTEHPVLYREKIVEEPAVLERAHVHHDKREHVVHHDKRENVHRHHEGVEYHEHATVGQKVKGTMKQMVGAITGNEAKKEEGKLLKQGIEPGTVNEPNLSTF